MKRLSSISIYHHGILLVGTRTPLTFVNKMILTCILQHLNRKKVLRVMILIQDVRYVLLPKNGIYNHRCNHVTCAAQNLVSKLHLLGYLNLCNRFGSIFTPVNSELPNYSFNGRIAIYKDNSLSCIGTVNLATLRPTNFFRGNGTYFPRANGAKRRSGRKPGARVTNSAQR